jgi:hypothetical protein
MLLLAACGPRPERGPAPTPGSAAPGIPGDALALLARSARESCADCARRDRERAFARLDREFAPGTRLASEEGLSFVKERGDGNELALASWAGETRLTFRFHTAASHLVGVSEQDWTGEALAEAWASFPEGALLSGILEVVAYPYGDGPSYLYSAAAGHLQIQCRVLEIGAAAP